MITKYFIKNLKITLLFTLISCSSFSQENELNFNQKQILIVYGGYLPHQPEQFAKKIKKWLKKNNAKVILSNSTKIYSNSKVMNEVDLIIQSITMLDIKESEIEGLEKAVLNGTGIVGFHGGIGDSFRKNTKFQYIVGGQFVDHPGGHVSYTVNIKDKTDFITKDLDDFNLTSEQYYMHIDPNIKVLATTRFNGDHHSWIKNAVVPVMWKKYYGKGRVFYCSLGHSLEIFDIPEMKKIMARGIFWASKSKYESIENWLSPVYKN